METRANYVLIGAFTLGVVLAAFGFVFWLQGGSRGQATQALRIVSFSTTTKTSFCRRKRTESS